jgi:exodeoxyribonuclease VII small subunit
MKPIKANLTYEEAYEELLQIASEIEEESVSVDVLATKVKRSSELKSFFQNKIKATEKDVLNIIQKMENKPTP